MSKRTTGSITPGRIRKISAGISNTQPTFDDDDVDDFDMDQNEFDENFPMIRNVPFYSQQQQHRTTVQQPNQNKKNDTYLTPQIKRKRIQDQVTYSPPDSLQELMNMFKDSLDEVNRKIDMMNKRDVVIEKKFENVEKSLSGLVRKVFKHPTQSEPPVELPVIEHDGRNLFSIPIGPTPAYFMKRLINELFTKNEIMDGEHEKMNERTTKIKKAIKVYFFQNEDPPVDGFWENEGKVIRGNQRRGLVYRNKLLPEDDA